MLRLLRKSGLALETTSAGPVLTVTARFAEGEAGARDAAPRSMHAAG